MATATYTPETGSSTLSGLGRKVQAGVYRAAQFGYEEFGWFQDLDRFNVALSQREITYELDLLEGTGASFIPEGGKEARPSSPNTVTATLTFLLLNKRWTVSKTTQMISGAQSTRAYIEDQFKFQGRKATEAIRKKIAQGFYGLSSGTICKLADVASGPTYGLKDLFGVSGLGSTSHNLRCADFFVGAASGANRDFVADLDPGGPTLNSIEGIASTSHANNTITTDNVFTSDDISDLIVFANNVENATMASGTERNLNMVGLIDGTQTASVHGVTSATYAKWAASTADTTGGRFTGIRLMKARDAIMNLGGGKANRVIWAQGVKNDVVAQLQAGLRFSDAYAMEMEGAPKSRGIEFSTSRLVPDGFVFVADDTDSVHRVVLAPQVNMPSLNDGDKLQDDSGSIYSADFILALAWTNRGNVGYFSGLQQS